MPTPTDALALVPQGHDVPGALSALLGALAAGDRGALAYVYRQHGDLVYRTALRLTGCRADAEDVAQDLFVGLHAIVPGFTGRAEQFPGWLRRVAVRSSLMRMRGGRRRREVSAAETAALVTRPDDVIGRLSIDTALTRLSVEHRTVFLLKEVEGYSHAEIAESLGISVASSEARLHRARRQLRDLLQGSR